MAATNIQDHDVFASDGPGIVFSEDGQTWTITEDVVVASSDDEGVFSARSGSALFNNGTVLSEAALGAGVMMVGPDSLVTNAAGARIIGTFSGIILRGDGATIHNHGAILGLGSVGVDFDSPSLDVTLTNDGSIFGREVGIRALADHDGGDIRNAGLISSAGVGISVITAPGLTTVIVNAAGGTIRGGSGPFDSAIHATRGTMSLQNHGIIDGDIVSFGNAGPENDRIVNTGKILGEVVLGNGNDTFAGTGGTAGDIFGDTGNDRLVGGSAADKLYGGPDNDRLIGAAGNDRLDGGFGLDTLTGGKGSDRFIFQDDLSPALNVDRITDFAVAVDKIVLEETVFRGIGHQGVLAAGLFHVGAAAHDATDRIIYNPNNGFLTYDANGNHFGHAVHFATLAPHLALTHTDFLVTEILVA